MTKVSATVLTELGTDSIVPDRVFFKSDAITNSVNCNPIRGNRSLSMESSLVDIRLLIASSRVHCSELVRPLQDYGSKRNASPGEIGRTGLLQFSASRATQCSRFPCSRVTSIKPAASAWSNSATRNSRLESLTVAQRGLTRLLEQNNLRFLYQPFSDIDTGSWTV